MAEKVLMTALSPTMEEGTIVSWNKKEGDSVAAGDLLCEVETDKATMDYESTQEGVLLRIVKAEGTSSRVGDTIAILGEQGEDIDSLLQESADGSQPSGPEGESAAEAAAPEAHEAAARSRDSAGAQGDGARVKASPLARKIASERGIDLSRVSGSGPAYFFYFVQCLIGSAVEAGLEEETARQLVLGTFFGSARLLELSGSDPGELLRGVCSKGGTTEAALDVLREAGFEDKVQKAVLAARRRSMELSKGS